MPKDMERSIPSGVLYNLTDEQIDKARRLVASNAKDIDDCAFLFEILGLLPPPPPEDPEEVKAYRKEELAKMRKEAGLARQAALAKQLRDYGRAGS